MILRINEDSMPIKYILGIEKELPGYPEPMDILYHTIELSVRNPSRYKGTFTRHHCVTYWFKDVDESIIDESINKLTQTGHVIQTNDIPGKESYKIIINPFQ
jgi:hypothetical protein|tara:strand:+ start:182 stop:487 length:306 start_codon:yes stop_codon:yes gene_type:complete